MWDVTVRLRKLHCRQIYFYSHIPCGMWLSCPMTLFRAVNFYSHIPCGMWPVVGWNLGRKYANFYSHIPCGMWHKKDGSVLHTKIDFYSHIPCGMWLAFLCEGASTSQFLLTHPVWDVTLADSNLLPNIKISTHTSRVGCDCFLLLAIASPMPFLLTHPVWDVTFSPSKALMCT